MDRIGGYRVVEELGVGGMGTVYLAEDAAGARVALKVVHPHLLATPGFFKRFLREAEVGRQVRHENVVQTLDADATDHDGKTVHFLVMEYVEGRSLRRLLQDLGRVPETLLREIAEQAAAGLAAIHELQIIHRDLKPENVLITPDDQLRIMDLGVAKLQEASVAITADGQFAGSVLYAAPEQFRDDDVGPAADLYSLGVLLYELATGENPFRRDDVATVIKAHLTFAAPPASDRSPDLSPFFSELLATLLGKSPAERIDSAATLVDILRDGEDSDWWAERAKRLAARRDRRPRVPVPRETDELHGRAAAMETLREAWDAVCAGDGRTVLVEGEAGIGKTRLVDQFLRGLEAEDVHALYGSYPPTGGSGGLTDAILDQFGSGALAESLAPYLTVTPSLVPAFAAQVRHETPPEGSAALRGDALQAVVCHLARALAEEKPTVWVVDDLQFASEESRAVALALARAAEGHRLLLVLTTRAELPESELEHFGRLPGFRRLPLGRLSPRQVIELLRDALRSEVLAEKLGGAIAYKSDGIPFFVFEMLRGLKEGAFLRQMPDGSYVQTQVIDDIEVPSAVKDLIEGRLRGLSKDERALLDVGAVQGLTFESRLVAEVLGRKRFGVLQDLAEIERRLGVVRAAGRRYRFDHPQLQEVIYGNLSEELREECHALLAEAAAGRGDPGGEDHHFIASHHLRGSRPREALPHLEPALDHLEKSYRNAGILDLGDRALASSDLLDDMTRLAVQTARAAVFDRRGRRAEQKVALDDAFAAAAGDPAAEAKVHLLLGNYHHAVSSYDQAAASYRAALELVPQANDPRRKASATTNLGLVEIAAGRDTEALELFRRAERLWREVGDRRGEAATIGNVGLALSNLGQHAESCAYYEKQIEMARELGDKELEARGEANLAIHWSHQGRYAEMEARIGRALELFREAGSRLGEAQNLSNLGFLCEFLGRDDAAQDLYRRALAMSRETGYRRGEGFALRGLSGMAERAGDLDEAVRLCEESLRVRREIGHEYGVFGSLIELGRVEAARGDVERAAELLDEVVARIDETTRPEVLVLAAAERAVLPGGDPATAARLFAEHVDRIARDDMVRIRYTMWQATGEREHLDEAHRLLMKLRDHAPEADREPMIENVPLHRAITVAHAAEAG